MAKYKIRRVVSSKTVVAQAGFNEMTNIVDTKDESGVNAFADQATDPELIVQGTAGMDYVKDKQGNVSHLVLHQDGEESTGIKIQ